jgi:hypothetical protein
MDRQVAATHRKRVRFTSGSPEVVTMVTKPQETDTCMNSICGHPFGLHFTTHIGAVVGCAALIQKQQKFVRVTSSCECAGFLVKWE